MAKASNEKKKVHVLRKWCKILGTANLERESKLPATTLKHITIGRRKMSAATLRKVNVGLSSFNRKLGAIHREWIKL